MLGLLLFLRLRPAVGRSLFSWADPKKDSSRLSVPSARPPTSTRLSDSPNMSTVRLRLAERGTKDLGDQIRLLSAVTPAFSASE